MRRGLRAALALLRGVLGAAFVLAGLAALATPELFDTSGRGSFHAQLLGAAQASATGGLLRALAHVATPAAALVATAMVALGLAALAGVLVRPAALVGIALSIVALLGVPVAHLGPPSALGALVAWSVLLAGGPGAGSLEALVARRGATRREPSSASAPAISRRSALGALGALGALLVVTDALAARLVAPGDTAPGTASGAAASGATAPGGPDQAAAAGAAPALPVDGRVGGADAALQAAASPPAGTPLGLAAEVPVGGAASFTDPAQGIPAFVVQPERGVFRAFSAVCTHAGCQVGFEQAEEQFVCPCHGAVFDAATGAVIQGPATRPLASIPLALGANGELYVDG